MTLFTVIPKQVILYNIHLIHLMGYVGKKSVTATSFIMNIISYYASFWGEESGNKNSAGSSSHKSVCVFVCMYKCACVYCIEKSLEENVLTWWFRKCG